MSDILNLLQTNIDNAVSQFSTLLLKAADVMNKNMCIDPNKPRVSANWFDQNCLEKKKQVRVCLQKYQRNKNEENKTQYVLSRRSYKQLLERKREAFNKSKITKICDNINNSTVFWREVKSVMNVNRHKTNNIHTAEWFTFFRNTFQSPVLNPPICEESKDIIYIRGGTHEEDLNSDITEEEILIALSKQKLKKVPRV